MMGAFWREAGHNGPEHTDRSQMAYRNFKAILRTLDDMADVEGAPS
jgi:hypothetical protein